MGQGFAITRFLGGKLGYYPTDPLEAYEVDQLVDTFADCIDKVYKPHFIKDEIKQEEALKELFEQVLPKFLDFITPICTKGAFLCGDKLTVADFWIGGLYTNYLANESISFAKDRFAETLAKYPDFEAYGKRYCEAVKTYLDARPAYPI